MARASITYNMNANSEGYKTMGQDLIKGLKWGIVFTFIFLYIQGCQCSSTPADYAPFPVDGWGEKYFNAKDKPLESKKWAYYYRKAYYRNGIPDPDSLATDYYMTGEKKSQGYLISENPETYHGERILFFSSGSLEKQYYDNGVPCGEWLFYLEDGSLSSRSTYKDGVVDHFSQYDRDGKKNRDGIYNSNGVYFQDIYYYSNGNINYINIHENKDDDSFVSIMYYESGKIKYKARFVKAPDFATSHSYRTAGDVFNYDENGHLTITNNDPKPIQIQKNTQTTYSRRTTSAAWDRGYSYGWEVGYQDALDANGAWASFDDSGKGGDFLDGYTAGYIDGYENGKDDRDEDDEEIEDL